MFINELDDLEDIMNSLVFEDEPSIFNEEYSLELIETALHLMDEFVSENPTIISEPMFQDILLEEIKELFYIQFEDEIFENDDIEDDMNDLFEKAIDIFTISFNIERSINQENIGFIENNESENEINIIEQKIQNLRNAPQPEQRTSEWYQFRWNLITASNAYKAFESQPTINQLIYEKCQPLKDTITANDMEVKLVNTNTPLHWGQKYEPLSIMLYEFDNNTKVEDFGCIQHPKYKFIGASPDGIVVDKKSERYGRMLELKNVVSREINGIPKKEYWIQMQLQMEVCDLNECDFLETKFVEYPDSYSYQTDIIMNDQPDENTFDATISLDGKQKGIIIYFHTKEGKPFYAYKPLNVKTNKEVLDWEENTLSLYQSEEYNYTFFKFIYWKLEKLSCVLVLRNREWFVNNVGQLEKVWKIIEEERVTGYEHRAPIKKSKKEFSAKPQVSESQGCFLKFNKIIKIDS